MIKKNIKLYLLIFLLFLIVFVIPFSFSKYTTTLSKKIMLNIKSGDIAYLKEYDGQNNLLGFDKTDITSFERNTTLTKVEVLQKENVQLISNEENDGYKSNIEVYGWIEDNHFYWWSEANKVYFHPKTLGAFREISTIQTIDLTGLDTSKVENFANWFYNDTVLTTINGKINTSGLKYETGDNVSFYKMFSYCNKLTSIDLSEFDTRNATNMNNMFSFCSVLKKLDLSNFDTSKVVNMGMMFCLCLNLKVLDLSNFNTSRVKTMNSLFNDCKNLEIVIFGDEFNTSRVTTISSMFYRTTNLKVIYAQHDFDISSITDTSAFIFTQTNSLVGGYETEYETPFDENHRNYEYTKISNENQAGYFTYYESINNIKFNITYDLDGGIAHNPDYYYYNSSSIVLNQPAKKGYTFIGWTGTNGEVPQKDVIIDTNLRVNNHYIANYKKNEDFYIEGPCTFSGSSNITGDNCKSITSDGYIIDFTNKKYIDTGIQLFNSQTKDMDFEIEFTIDNVNDYTHQATIINSMYETNPWPGFVFRINTSNNAFELRAGYNGNNSWFPSYSSKKVKIKRLNQKLYYSIDDEDLIQIVDFTNYNLSFDLPLTIGAGLTNTGTPQRYFKGTLSNISIKLEE